MNKNDIENYLKEKGTSEDSIMSISVEIMKSTCEIMYKLITETEKSMKGYDRNDAILYGLIIRLYKLMNSYLQNICNRKMEIAFIIQRCIVETIINLLYIIENESEELFNNFVEYSLKTEKTLYDDILNNIKQRGETLPIETRMLDSIKKTFKMSGVDIELIDSKKKYSWSKSIFERFKNLGFEDLYRTIYGGQNHYTHGNWQELHRNQLKFINGKFYPNLEYQCPRPQVINPITMLICICLRHFIQNVDVSPLNVSEIEEMLEQIQENASMVDQVHESSL